MRSRAMSGSAGSIAAPVRRSKAAAIVVRGSLHLIDPVLQIVVGRYPRDPAVPDREEGADAQPVSLPMRLGQDVIGLEIGAMEIELGRGAPAIGSGHDDDVRQALAIML